MCAMTPYIIWDWNGTLLDDVAASLASVNDMLARRGMPPIGLPRYKACICVPIRGFYAQVFDLEHEDYDAILAEYNAGYLLHLRECRLAAGALEALDAFAAAGVRQAIVSSSHQAQLQENAARYGVADRFDALLGADDYQADSKIGRAAAYLAAAGADPAQVLVIGDLAHDAEMARSLGTRCVLLTAGHEQPERLQAAGVPLIDSLFSLVSHESKQTPCAVPENRTGR